MYTFAIWLANILDWTIWDEKENSIITDNLDIEQQLPISLGWSNYSNTRRDEDTEGRNIVVL